MADYRQVHTKMWTDEWFLELEPENKLLWIYLFSNKRACLSGLYDIPMRVIMFETGLSREAISNNLEVFAAAGKAFYEDGWVLIPKLMRYNANGITSQKIQANLRNDVFAAPNIPLKRRWLDEYNSLIPPDKGECRMTEADIGYNAISDTVSDRVSDTAPIEQNITEHEQNIHGDDETSPSKPEPAKRKPSLHNEIRAALEIHFSEVTGLQRPKADTQSKKRSAGTLWWTPLREIAELCEWEEPRACQLIDATVVHLKTSGMTIASPKSIVLTARAVIADNVPGVRMPRAGPRTCIIRPLMPDGSTPTMEVVR